LPFGRISLYIACAHVGFARVFFHCHYIGDILGGFLIGVVLQQINYHIAEIIVNS